MTDAEKDKGNEEIARKVLQKWNWNPSTKLGPEGIRLKNLIGDALDAKDTIITDYENALYDLCDKPHQDFGWINAKKLLGWDTQTNPVKERDEKIKELTTKLSQSEARNEGMVEALKKYGRHAMNSFCGYSALNGEICNCGLKEILDGRTNKLYEAKENVIGAAKYLVYPSKYESRSEVCHECGTYGVGELREALQNLEESRKAQGQ